MADFTEQILTYLSRKNYVPLKPKALARQLNVPSELYADFRRALRALLQQKRIQVGKNHTVRGVEQHGTASGVYRGTSSGFGFVRPHMVDGAVSPDIYIPEGAAGDAATGDEVLVRIRRRAGKVHGPSGEVIQVTARATRAFVGTYFERHGQGYVRVDGTVFSHSIWVGDPGAKGARPDDKVVLEMLRFPTAEDRRGEGVIIEVLGPRGKPGVDTLSIIRAFGLPEPFADDALAEARRAADAFDEKELNGREDFTAQLTITIDPADARDFDDAVSLAIDPKSKHWQLSVHIADVAHFCPPGGPLDREARKRATSVYLPQRVLPMFPEIISNSLASLQQGRVRYVKSAMIDYTPAGQRTATRFAEGAIVVRRRFTYDEVSALLADPEKEGAACAPEVVAMVLCMRDLAMLLRRRRMKRGALELNMPEVELDFDEQGRVAGAHFARHDVSHQLIEEFMLAANEAVAEHLGDLGVPFLRRVHTAPDDEKLRAFGEFSRSLGYKVPRHVDRFSLQRILEESADKPDAYAVHYALLRSLKQAVYAPDEEGHYALAIDDYCHFTSPIRRYPDLTVHRILGRWLRTGKARSDDTELAALGVHCSKMERRADLAERELIKLKMLLYLEDRIGLRLEGIITGVADYGFYAQAAKLPIEGLVHISTLEDDYYYYDETTHSLTGRKTKRRYRLGDRVNVEVVRVDVPRRLLDFRVVPGKKGRRGGEAAE
ncbi:MAG: ribonuclease R [Gemmataceae bacterium]|nr:ribonuclease R [Gemmataceae bacterium]